MAIDWWTNERMMETNHGIWNTKIADKANKQTNKKIKTPVYLHTAFFKKDLTCLESYIHLN